VKDLYKKGEPFYPQNQLSTFRNEECRILTADGGLGSQEQSPEQRRSHRLTEKIVLSLSPMMCFGDE